MAELREYSINDFAEIKALFKNVFTSPPWTEDWSNDEQLDNVSGRLFSGGSISDPGVFFRSSSTEKRQSPCCGFSHFFLFSVAAFGSLLGHL